MDTFENEQPTMGIDINNKTEFEASSGEEEEEPVREHIPIVRHYKRKKTVATNTRRREKREPTEKQIAHMARLRALKMAKRQETLAKGLGYTYNKNEKSIAGEAWTAPNDDIRPLEHPLEKGVPKTIQESKPIRVKEIMEQPVQEQHVDEPSITRRAVHREVVPQYDYGF